MPKDIPGFYYDAEKNRYFSCKSRIPGSSSAPKPTITKPTTPKVVQSSTRSRLRMSKLLQVRELHGNVISSNKGTCNFNEEFRKIQASSLKVWRYPETNRMGDSALERAHVNMQRAEGETTTSVLLTGGKNGSLRMSEVGKFQQQRPYRVQSIAAQAWPIIKDDQTTCSSCPESICRDEAAPVVLSSGVSCIKLFRRNSLFGVGGDNIQHALVSTLGSESCAGLLYVLNLMEPIRDSDQISLDIVRRSKLVASLGCTIWTADCGSLQSRAAVGTNLGAALVDLTTGKKLWVLRSQSDVLAQQFIHSGNAILCGLRNGLIVTVDVREKQVGSSSNLSSRPKLVRYKASYSHKTGSVGKSITQWCKLSGNIQTSHNLTLPSSISSLVSLQFDDQYFLASSMDGSVKLYDQRICQRGPVQSYDGHVNSYTRLQLGVDPLERFVMSGGEDSYLRLWSIKSGELLFQEKFSDAVLSTVCWRGEENGPMPFAGVVTNHHERQSCRDYFDETERYGTGAWLGSDKELFYVKYS